MAEILLIGGPANGRRVSWRGKEAPPFVRIRTTEPPAYRCNEPAPIVDLVYRVKEIQGHKTRYYVATHEKLTADEIMEALLKGYNSDTSKTSRRV